MTEQCCVSNIDKLLDTAISDLLSRPWSDQMVQAIMKLFERGEGEQLTLECGLMGFLKDIGFSDPKLSDISLDCFLQHLDGFLRKDKDGVVKIKARRRRLYVGKGLDPGRSTVLFNLGCDKDRGRGISFPRSLNVDWEGKYCAYDGNTPLKYSGSEDRVAWDLPLEVKDGKVELTVDEGCGDSGSGQPDYLHFSVLGKGGDASGEFRLAFLAGGDVKKVIFDLAGDSTKWKQEVILKETIGTRYLRREMDTFHLISQNVRWFAGLRQLDVILGEGEAAKHFGNGEIEIPMESQEKSTVPCATLSW